MEVPTPSPALVLAARVEDQLVEVPPIVPHVVSQSFLARADGCGWAQISEPTGVYFLRWAPPTPYVDSPSPPPLPQPGKTARPGRDINTGPG